MEDPKDTPAVPVDTGADEAQPVDTEQPAAAADVSNDQASDDDKPSPDASAFDDDTLKWFESKGIDPNSPEAITKLAKSAREAEKAMHQKAGEASQLKKSMEGVADTLAEEEAAVTGQDPETVKLLKRLIVRDSLRDFWETHPGAKQHEQELAQVISERPHLAGDLEAAYALVQTKNADSLKSEGKKEALKTLASKQQAAAPAGAAVNPVSTAPAITRALIREKTQAGDLNWLNKNQDKINQLVAEGKLQ